MRTTFNLAFARQNALTTFWLDQRANAGTARLFALANEQTEKLFALANEQTEKFFLANA
jgi:hypothetical protein